MAKITKENILSEYKKAKAEYSELSKKSYDFKIKTGFPFLAGMSISGCPDIETIEGVYINVKEYFDNMEAAKKDLGIIKGDSDKFYGFTKADWIDSLKTRVSQIQDSKRLKELSKVLPVLEKNLTDSDKFELDMESIENNL